MFRTARLALAGIVLAAFASAAAGAYPERPLRLIVAYPAGASTNDILARAIAPKLSEALRQNVVVENRPGAGGTIGTTIGFNAEPDGYTLLLGANGPMSISPNVIRVDYDPVNGFEPVLLFGIIPYLVVTNPNVPAKDLNDLIALAKKKRLKFASAGIASTPHLCGELLKLVAGVDMLHVAYKGGAPATVALISGEVDMYCAGAVGQSPGIRAGRTVGLAVTWKDRLPGIPEIPSAAEQGVKGLDVASWNGILMPKGTPAPIVKRIHDELVKILNTPQMKDFLVKQGVELVSLGPKEFRVFLKEELDKWGDVIKKAKIRIQ